MVRKYKYHFGIDSIDFSKKEYELNTCFISLDIDLGFLKEDEYIQLLTESYTDENSSIEFNIIDGPDIKPILPIEAKKVENEKIFFGIRPRFSIDETKEIVVKKDGIITDITLEQAIATNVDGYTVDYYPINPYNLKIKSNIIKVKVIKRLYDPTKEAPYIKRITIRKFGGGYKWEKNLLVL